MELQGKELKTIVVVKGGRGNGSNVETTAPNGEQFVLGRVMPNIAKTPERALECTDFVLLGFGFLQTDDVGAVCDNAAVNDVCTARQCANIPGDKF